MCYCFILYNGIANFYIIGAYLLIGKFIGSSLIILFEKKHYNFLRRETKILFCFGSHKAALLRLDTLDLIPSWVIPSTDSTTVQCQLRMRTHLYQSSQRCLYYRCHWYSYSQFQKCRLRVSNG